MDTSARNARPALTPVHGTLAFGSSVGHSYVEWIAVKRLVDENRLPHLLFYGPPGTGKTSTVLAVARRIYGNSMSNMVLELNASDDRGIDVVRNQIVEFASTSTIFRCGMSTP